MLFYEHCGHRHPNLHPASACTPSSPPYLSSWSKQTLTIISLLDPMVFSCCQPVFTQLFSKTSKVAVLIIHYFNIFELSLLFILEGVSWSSRPPLRQVMHCSSLNVIFLQLYNQASHWMEETVEQLLLNPHIFWLNLWIQLKSSPAQSKTKAKLFFCLFLYLQGKYVVSSIICFPL